MKQMLVEYVSAYLRGGTTEMATYVDNASPLETSAEFRKVMAASLHFLVQSRARPAALPRGLSEGPARGRGRRLLLDEGQVRA